MKSYSMDFFFFFNSGSHQASLFRIDPDWWLSTAHSGDYGSPRKAPRRGDGKSGSEGSDFTYLTGTCVDLARLSSRRWTLTPAPQLLPCMSWMVKLPSWEPGASPDPGTCHISHFRRPNSNQERSCIRKRADILPGTYLMCQFSHGCFIADLASNSMNVVPVNNMEVNTQ